MVVECKTPVMQNQPNAAANETSHSVSGGPGSGFLFSDPIPPAELCDDMTVRCDSARSGTRPTRGLAGDGGAASLGELGAVWTERVSGDFQPECTEREGDFGPDWTERESGDLGPGCTERAAGVPTERVSAGFSAGFSTGFSATFSAGASAGFSTGFSAAFSAGASAGFSVES